MIYSTVEAEEGVSGLKLYRHKILQKVMSVCLGLILHNSVCSKMIIPAWLRSADLSFVIIHFFLSVN